MSLPRLPSILRKLSEHKHFGSALVFGLASVLIVLLFLWMGFDFRVIGSAYPGLHNDIHTNMYQVYQTSENLLRFPWQLGFSQMLGGGDRSLGYTVAHYGVALTNLPIYLLSSRNYILTYNLHVMLTFSFSAWFAFLLIRYLFDLHTTPSLFGALMFAFSPYRLVHLELGHPEHLCTHFFVLALYALHRMIDQPRWQWAAIIGSCMTLMLISSGYYAVIFILLGSVILLFTLFTQRARISKAFVLWGLTAAGIALVTSWPFLSIRFGLESVGHSALTKVFYSASVENLITGGSILYRHLLPWEGEKSSFLGFTSIFFALLVLIWYQDIKSDTPKAARTFSSAQLIKLYGIVLLLGVVFAMGPDFKITTDFVYQIFMPYELLMNLPGFDTMRAVVRFMLMAVVSMSLFGAVGMAFLLKKLERPAWQAVLLLGFSVFFIVETLPDPWILQLYEHTGIYQGHSLPTGFPKALTLPREERIFYPYFPETEHAAVQWLAAQPADTLVWHYPIEMLGETVYSWMPAHGQPTLLGPETAALAPAWSRSLLEQTFPSSESIALLRELGADVVTVHLEHMDEAQLADYYAELEHFLGSDSDLIYIGLYDGVAIFSIIP